ncbi:MAG TPA: S8 family serine peptidase [Pyrinomonadaceae bacterium]|nr:S8 family serine peptidase [Pyrinomonadaceae bacterium]
MLKRIPAALTTLVLLFLVASADAQAAVIGPSLQKKLAGLSTDAKVGTVIVAFNTTNGLQDSHLNVLRSLGITGGITLNRLGMVAVVATAGQVRALAANSAVRSVWSNDRLYYFDKETSTLTGVERMKTDPAFTRANGGLPVSGKGDFSVVINDSGIDATHPDLQLGKNVIQNVQILTDDATASGFTSLQVIENVPDTDLNVGHGTHCAGIVGGTGQQSGGLYAGVAPGAKLIGTGSGAVLFVLNALGGFEWSLTNQSLYGIRVISNSYGGSGAFDPNDPVAIASKTAHDNNITVVFAAGNSGPGKDTMNPYAKAPWVIGVAAGTKEGGLASFSSRGVSKDVRLSNSDPLDDYNAPTITAPGAGREFASDTKFSAAVVSTRSKSNVFANGLTDDAELPVNYLPYYTQISGTSMSTPFVAGTVALMLDADITLTPDEIKQILVDTASRMPGYDEWEVGAGYINVYATVDKVFNRSKAYGQSFSHNFNETFTVSGPAPEQAHIDFSPAASPCAAGSNTTCTSSNAHAFTVQPGMTVLDIFATFDTAAGTGDGNVIGIIATDPNGNTYSSGLALPVEDSPSREIVVKNPAPGPWLVEVRGARGLTAAPQASLPTSGAAAPGPVDMTITQQQFNLAPVADIQGHPAQSEIETVLKNRQMDTEADGLFHPDDALTRGDFAQLLYINTALRQTVGASPKFADVSPELAPVAEAATASGSTLRDYDFTPAGMISANGSNFNPTGTVSRLDMAVALVRALGLDADAKSKAGTNVTVEYNGTTLTLADNASIPAAYRGYVQDALDRGLLQATFSLSQGPFDFQPTLKANVNPNNAATRAFMAYALDNYRQHFVAGN